MKYLILLTLFLLNCNVYKSNYKAVEVVVVEKTIIGQEYCKYYVVSTKYREDMTTYFVDLCSKYKEDDTLLLIPTNYYWIPL